MILIDHKLLFSLIKKELKERYIGTSFGHLWYIISPIITIFIYTIIFSDFMKMKLNIVNNEYSYSVYLIPGLLSWNFFSSVILRFSSLFYEKANLIKKVALSPLYYFLSTFFCEFIIYAISMLFGIIFLLLINYPINTNILWVFLFMIIFSIFTFSIGITISLFVPFFKDLKEIVNIALQLIFWMTPIIYVKELVYDKYPFLIDYNVIYKFIEPMQYLFLYSKPIYFTTPFILSIISLLISAFLYKKLIGEIKDIL